MKLVHHASKLAAWLWHSPKLPWRANFDPTFHINELYSSVQISAACQIVLTMSSKENEGQIIDSEWSVDICVLGPDCHTEKHGFHALIAGVICQQMWKTNCVIRLFLPFHHIRTAIFLTGVFHRYFQNLAKIWSCLVWVRHSTAAAPPSPPLFCFTLQLHLSPHSSKSLANIPFQSLKAHCVANSMWYQAFLSGQIQLGTKRHFP